MKQNIMRQEDACNSMSKDVGQLNVQPVPEELDAGAEEAAPKEESAREQNFGGSQGWVHAQ